MPALALLTCLAVGWAPPGQAAEAVPVGSPTSVPWSGSDGTTFLVAVPEQALVSFAADRSAALAKERDRLTRIGAEMLGAQSGSLLGELVPRVDLYADWVYSWVESYVAAFQIVVAGTRSWVGDAAQGPRTAYRTAMQDLARQRFDSMVVTPTEPGAKLADAVTRMQSVMTDMWAGIAAADRQRWNAFVARQVAAGAAVEKMANPVAAELCTAPPPIVAGLATDPGPSVTARMAIPTDLYFWRVARPFATRATALAMRVAFGGLWLTGGGIGAGAATGSSALSFGLATAAVWSIDYALNVADAILHRATFERELIGAMAMAVATETASLQGRVDGRLQDAFTRLERCPPVGPQSTGLVSQ